MVTLPQENWDHNGQFWGSVLRPVCTAGRAVTTADTLRERLLLFSCCSIILETNHSFSASPSFLFSTIRNVFTLFTEWVTELINQVKEMLRWYVLETMFELPAGYVNEI